MNTKPTPAMPAPARIGTPEAAAYLGITPRELKRLRAAKRVTFYRISHRTVTYSLADLDAFLKTRRVEAVA